MLTISPFLVINDNTNINNERARKIKQDKHKQTRKQDQRAQRLKRNPWICLKERHTQATNVHIHELTPNVIQRIKVLKTTSSLSSSTLPLTLYPPPNTSPPLATKHQKGRRSNPEL